MSVAAVQGYADPPVFDEFAWLVGLFEGEGCVDVRRDAHRRYLRLQVQATDEDTVRRVHTAAGCGFLGGPYKRIGGRRDVWTWGAASHEAYDLLTRMLPHLSQRRQRKALEAMEEAGFGNWHSQLTLEGAV